DTDELVAVNHMAEKMSGIGRGDLLAMPATALYQYESPGGQQRIRRASQTTTVFHSQDGFFLRTKKDGIWLPVNLTITRLHVTQRPLALITARDMREQREAHQQVKRMEAELRRVMASVSDCLWSAEIDAGGNWRYRYLSPVIERITGQTPSYFQSGK